MFLNTKLLRIHFVFKTSISNYRNNTGSPFQIQTLHTFPKEKENVFR